MNKLEKIEQLVKRRGIFWISSEIYGGLTGFYDYGAIGTKIKRKFENLWRRYFLSLNDNFFEIEACDIMPEKVFIASGHVASFVDPIAKCKKCGTIHRADHILEDFLGRTFEGLTESELTELIKKHNVRCPACKGELEEVGTLNMMFPLSVGPEKNIKAYLRPETAQGAYVNFLRHFEILRKKLPLGLAIVGKAYRNEISPRQLVIRMREFTQAELQIFFDPDKLDEHERWDEVKNVKLKLLPVSHREKGECIEITCEEAREKMGLPKFYLWHMAKTQKFYLNVLSIPKEKFRFKELSEEERAFYNKIHWDVEIFMECFNSWREIGGIHYRTDHDLAGHQKVSGKSHEIFFEGKRFVPHVLELSFGVDRNIFALFDIFYSEREGKIVLRLPKKIAPFDVAVFPIVNKDGIDDKAREIYAQLKGKFDVIYDDSGSIGKRYARIDEIGVPFAITVDYQTLEDESVTIRDRDTTEQIRVKVGELEEKLRELLGKV
jgi:glycyl-tRNA synthetase